MWLDDIVGAIARGVLWTLTVLGIAWLLVAWGEARMSAVALRSIGDATWCMSLIEPVLNGAEQSLEQTWRAYTAMREVRP